MKTVDVILSCKCTVPVEYETDKTDVNDFTDEEIQELFDLALQAYDPTLEYDYDFEYVERIED